MVGVDTLIVFGLDITGLKFNDVLSNIYKHYLTKGINIFNNKSLNEFLDYANTNLSHYKLKGKTMTYSTVQFQNIDLQICKYYYRKEHLYLCLLPPKIITNSGTISIEFDAIEKIMHHNEIGDLLQIYETLTDHQIYKNDQKMYILNKMYT